MRRIVSVVVAFILFTFILYLAYSGNIVLLDFWTGLAIALAMAALGVLYWGFRPQINRSFKDRRDSHESSVESPPSMKKETQETLFKNKAKAFKLNVDNSLLDEINAQAKHEAVSTYPEAQLSRFTIQVFPFREDKQVNVYLDFYSKGANKTCCFVSYNCARQVEHLSPDKRSFYDSDRRVYTALPWKECPQWMQFAERAYSRIEPLTPDEKTGYHLSAVQNANIIWKLTLEDGFSGREHRFEWDGKGFDESNMTQSR